MGTANYITLDVSGKKRMPSFTSAKKVVNGQILQDNAPAKRFDLL